MTLPFGRDRRSQTAATAGSGSSNCPGLTRVDPGSVFNAKTQRRKGTKKQSRQRRVGWSKSGAYRTITALNIFFVRSLKAGETCTQYEETRREAWGVGHGAKPRLGETPNRTRETRVLPGAHFQRKWLISRICERGEKEKCDSQQRREGTKQDGACTQYEGGRGNVRDAVESVPTVRIDGRSSQRCSDDPTFRKITTWRRGGRRWWRGWRG
jgi:hypothetical protein